MTNIIKTLVLVMALVLALTAFTGCELFEKECTHEGTTELIPSVIPTCTETGMSLGTKCTKCGEIVLAPEVTPVRGHDKTTLLNTTADCVTAGVETWNCGFCGEDYDVEVEAYGHGLVEVEAKAATCTEDGYNAHKACSNCDYTEGKEVVAAGHNVGEDGVCAACGNTFVATAEELIAALEAGKNVVLLNSIEMDATLKCPYGNSVGVCQRGGVLDGNGYTLTVNGSGNYYAIITYGGTIKNLTIDAGFRAVVTYTPTEDVIIDNVTIYGDSICYGFNTAELATMEGIDLVVKNSTLCGWVSFNGGFENVSFESCTFAQGTYYDNVIGRLVKPYTTTTFTNCKFVKNAYLDLSALEAGSTVALLGCKVDGVDVTKSVFTTTEDDAEIPFTYEAPSGVELVIEDVEGGVTFTYVVEGDVEEGGSED